MNKQPSFAIRIVVLIIVIWFVQTLYLYQASRVGLNGWDDWGMLFYYDAYKMENKKFIDIKEEVLREFELTHD